MCRLCRLSSTIVVELAGGVTITGAGVTTGVLSVVVVVTEVELVPGSIVVVVKLD